VADVPGQKGRADALGWCSISPSQALSLLATDQWCLPPGGLTAMGNACRGWAGGEVYITLPALLSMARALFLCCQKWCSGKCSWVEITAFLMQGNVSVDQLC